MDITTPVLLAVGAILFIVLTAASCILWKRKKCGDRSKDPEVPVLPTTNPTSTTRIPIHKIMEGNVELPKKEEFEKLLRFKDTVGSKLTQFQGQRNNGEDGRNLNIRALPFDSNRVKLKNSLDNNDYVNATWLISQSEDPTYDSVDYSEYIPYVNIKFIIGQHPKTNTIRHHYQMLHENLVSMEIRIGRAVNEKPLIPGKVHHTENLSRRVLKMTQISPNLIKIDLELFDTTTSSTQYKHPITLFEVMGHPEDDLNDLKETNDLLESICLIRKHIKGVSNSMTIMVSDADGGINGAANFIALYNLLQGVDEGLTKNNAVKKFAPDLDIFREVNHLRRVRANMVDTFKNYKLLHQAVSWYGQNKAHFDQIQLKNFCISQETGEKKVIMGTNTPPASETSDNNLREEEYPDDVYFTEDIYVN